MVVRDAMAAGWDVLCIVDSRDRMSEKNPPRRNSSCKIPRLINLCRGPSLVKILDVPLHTVECEITSLLPTVSVQESTNPSTHPSLSVQYHG